VVINLVIVKISFIRLCFLHRTSIIFIVYIYVYVCVTYISLILLRERFSMFCGYS